MEDERNTSAATQEEDTYGLVMVIGNGFDLNLGLPTSYKNFTESLWWPFRNLDPESQKKENQDKEYGLGAYLNGIKTIEKWIDLEEQLHKYCAAKDPVLNKYLNESCLSDEEKDNLKRTLGTDNLSGQAVRDYLSYRLLKKDREDYELLCSHFFNYLNFMDYNVNPDSPAGKLLTNFSEKVDLLFTFNYTDINQATQKLGSPHIDPKNIVHVHGSIHGESSSNNPANPSAEKSTAILGIDDERPVLDSYQFMVKQYNENFYRVNSNSKMRSLNKALKKARNVIFFGLSFGDNDFSYFKDFFQHIDEMIHLDTVSIFCYRNQERLELLKHLAQERNQSSRSVKFLQFNNDFQILATGERIKSDGRMDDFIKSMRDRLSR